MSAADIRNKYISYGLITPNAGTSIPDSLSREYLISRGHLIPGNGEYSGDKAAVYLLDVLKRECGLKDKESLQAKSFYRNLLIKKGILFPKMRGNLR